MFRKSFAVAAVLAGGVFLTASWAQAQQSSPRSRSQMSLAERLEQFRRSLTGEPDNSQRSRQPATRQQPRQPRTARQSRPQGRSAATYPRGSAAEDRTPQRSSRQKPEFLPGFGLGGLISELTGGPDYVDDQQYRTPPRAGSNVQPDARRFRNSATARPRSATRPDRLPAGPASPSRTLAPSFAPTLAPTLADEPAATRPEQASPPAIVREESPRSSAGSYRNLQERLAAARRELSDQPRQPSLADGNPSVLTPMAEPRLASAVERETRVTASELTSDPTERSIRTEAFDASSLSPLQDDTLLFTRQSPSLKIATAGPRKIMVGKPAVYRVLVQNSGTQAARSVIVTIKVPEWADVVGTIPTSGTANPPVAGVVEEVQWKLDRIEPRTQESLELEIIPRKSRPFELAVGWSQSPVMAQATVEVQEPKLRLVIAGADEAMYGQSEIYKLTLSNPGNGDAENVTIRLMPIGQSNEAPVTHEIGTIRAGGRKVIEVELTPRQSGTLVIKAEASADGGLFSSAAEEVLVRRAGVQVAASGPQVQYAGTAASFEVQVTNSGNAPAEGVEVTAALPGQAEYVSSSGGGQYDAASGNVKWTVDRLLPGSVEVFSVQCALNAPGTNSLQVAVAAEGGLEHSAMATIHVEALADLKLEVIDPLGPVPVGQETTYDVIVRNRGTKSAEEVDVLVFFSTGVEPVSVEGGRHAISDGQVEFAAIPMIPAGGEVKLKIKARADMSGNHVFRVEVHCKTLGTSLVAEETTRFYSVGQSAQNSRSITPAPADHLLPVPARHLQ